MTQWTEKDRYGAKSFQMECITGQIVFDHPRLCPVSTLATLWWYGMETPSLVQLASWISTCLFLGLSIAYSPSIASQFKVLLPPLLS